MRLNSFSSHTKQAAPIRLIKPTLCINNPFCLKYSKRSAKIMRPAITIKCTFFVIGPFSDRQNKPKYIKLAIKKVFASVSKDKDSVDATAKTVNEEAVSVRAVSHSFSAWLALPSVNINREPYNNPHAIRAITKKNISFAFFISLDITTPAKVSFF